MVRPALLGAALLVAGCDGGAPAGNDAAAPPAGSASAGGLPQAGAGATASRTIIDNASRSADHKRLVAAVRTAGLEKVFAGAGPYTVFAPTDAAFAKLPAGSADAMLRPEGKAQLTRTLTYHVLPGVVTSADLRAAVQRRGGRTELATVGGGKLTVSDAGGTLVITDAKGGQARVTHVDAMQSNGVVHVVDAVLMPR